MSANIEPVEMFEANCSECGVASGLYMYEPAALEWAATHDAENHAEDDRSDEAYEQYRELRKER